MEQFNAGHLFSLTYGGEDFFLKAGTTLSLGDAVYFSEGLSVKVTKRFFGSDAIYWDVTLTNPSKENSLRIENLRSVDITVPLGDAELFTSRGTWGEDIRRDFYWESAPLKGSTHLECASGRSSQGTLPYFDINSGEEGLLCAIGWSGQWSADITQKDGDIRICGGVAGTDFYLLPGESLYVGSGIAVRYHSGQEAAHNRFRSIVRMLSPLGKPGRPNNLPVCLSFWGTIDNKDIKDIAVNMRKNLVDADIIWIDAGWFSDVDLSCRSSWVNKVGDWSCDKKRHRDGFDSVASTVHENEYDFLVWYEPERASESTPFAAAHPEAFLHVPLENEPFYAVFCGNVGEEIRSKLKCCLANLGCDAGYGFVYDTLAGAVKQHKLDWLRIDFNTFPLIFWDYNDIQGRKGVVQIKYINGLYKLLCKLMEEFPNLMIDNCASGGSRLDIEMMKYSVPLWRSDYQCDPDCDPDVGQSHSMGGAMWFASCAGAGGKKVLTDIYRLRSAYSGGFVVFGDETGDDPEFVEGLADGSSDLSLLKRAIDELNQVRDCYNGDFYPLSGQSADDKTIWCAWQYENGNTGVLQAFRRSECAQEEYVLNMHTCAGTEYSFYNFDTGERFTLNASELQQGLKVKLTDAYSSLILRYEIMRP